MITIRPIINGTSHCAVQFRCALACDTMAGANPANRPPIAAPTGLAPRCRWNSQYHAYAVPTRLSVRMTVKDTEGPSHSVSGAKRTAYTVIEVFTARLTAWGALSQPVYSGFSPCTTARAP